MNYTLITWASSGIWEATARRLANEGQSLILIARRFERLEKLKEEMASGVDIQIFTVDVTDRWHVETFFQDISDLSIDVLINNAGICLEKDSFQDYDADQLQKMIDVNISAFTSIARKAMPKLIESEGHLVNISSIAGREPYPWGSVYCASKAYVKHISQVIRKDLISQKVRVTDISPWAVETEFSKIRFGWDESKASSVYEWYQPLHPDDIADAIWYCISRPQHVCIDSMEVMATAQAGAWIFHKEN